MLPLAGLTSDHIPCSVQVGTTILKANIFRFEKCWMQLDSFMPTVQHCWNQPCGVLNPAQRISAKFKLLKRDLRMWSKELSQFNKLINNCGWVLALIDGLRIKDHFHFWEEISERFLNCISLICWKLKEFIGSSELQLGG